MIEQRGRPVKQSSHSDLESLEQREGQGIGQIDTGGKADGMEFRQENKAQAPVCFQANYTTASGSIASPNAEQKKAVCIKAAYALLRDIAARGMQEGWLR